MKNGKKDYSMGRAADEFLRGHFAAALRAMADEGLLVSGSELQVRRNLTVEQLQQLERQFRIFSLPDANATFYPAIFCDTELFESSELVSQRLGAKTGFEKWTFFGRPTQQLSGRTPMQALNDGDLDLVLQVADGVVTRKGISRGAVTAHSTTT